MGMNPRTFNAKMEKWDVSSTPADSGKRRRSASDLE
jgi:hypothetical protein